MLKTMFIGGPGAGKTRLSSYWPKPIYADCEGGLSSIADRKMPFVSINNSQDMLDLLAFLKMECRRPVRDRQYQTVVIDTLDAFQRKVKDEWLQANPGSQSFRGFDAWGYLDAKMQMLLTRLLNLDMNVIVCVHYKDKTIKEGTGENATERQELMLQLSGEVKDNVFNDFDLVGWLGKYYEAVDGQRVEKRGLTFKSTPEKPFLKDRLYVTPPWMEVTFSDEDYATLFSAFVERLDALQPGEDIGEIPTAGPEDARPSGGVVGPNSGGGPLPQQDPRDIPLSQYDKPTLQKMARDLGIKFQQNTIKAELIEAIETERKNASAKEEATPAAAPAAGSDASPASPPAGLPSATLAGYAGDKPSTSPAPATPVAPAPAAPAPAADGERGVEIDPDHQPMALADMGSSAPATPVQAEQVDDISTEVGKVDPSTGELLPMGEQEVADALGGEVISVTEAAETPVVAPASQPPAAATPAATGGRPTTCEQCGKDLAGENQDYVKLSQIKYRQYLCNADYLSRKKSA